MITTTLNRIREHSLSPYDWTKLLNGLGKTKADDEPLPFSKILEINGLDDALWCCRVEPQYAREHRLFAVACARRVEHLNPDPRVKNATDVAERYANGQATDEELRTAWFAAWAAWAAGDARDAAPTARNAAQAAWAATRDATWASGDAALAAAWASGDAAGEAAWAAAWDAEREWQKQEFLRVVTETEAREDGE